MRATSIWKCGFQSTVDNGRGHSMMIDLPQDKDGSDMGPTALELAMMGLSGCITTIFAVVAKAMRLEYSELYVNLDWEKDDNTNKIVKCNAFTKIKTEVDEVKVKKCFAQTLKLCPVGIIFRDAGIPLEETIELI